MSLKHFLTVVRERGYTLAQLRCDVPPTQDLLDLIERVGMARYERFVDALSRAFEKRQVKSN